MHENEKALMIKVKIDGVVTELEFYSYSGSRGYQYLMPNNRSSHGFPWPLSQKVGETFRINGASYEVLEVTRYQQGRAP